MNTFKEPEKELPIIADVDILVLGAGPAGISAAINASRQGVSTMLLEQSGDVGGISTIGLMSHWTGNSKGGFYEEILARSADPTENSEEFGFNGSMRQVINPEKLKTVLLNMLHEANVKVRLYTFACVPVMEDQAIKGVIIESKSGREVILAKIVIDCTGDGDIAAKTGAEYYIGRETDGKMQPATLMFKLAGVDYKRAVFPGSFEHYIDLPSGEIQSLGKEHLPFPAGHVLLYRSTLPGIVTCNMTNCLDIDGTNSDDLTKATYVCRNQINPIVSFLRQYVPGYENCYVISSASLIGIRETRHFIGIETITEDDIANARIFKNWAVTKVSFNFDVHNITGNGLDETGSQATFKQTNSYTIPYGCFVPKKIDNLLLAGRNISGTHMAHSNFRAMPICANMGQSVGIAAALCVKNNVLPRNLDVSCLQSTLIKNGVTLD